MLRYMLDTDICSYVMKRSHDALLQRLQKVPVSDVCVSVVTKSELLYENSGTRIRGQTEMTPFAPENSGTDGNDPIRSNLT